MGRGVAKDLRWWAKALRLPNDGVAFFSLNHFPPSGSVDLLEFAYDDSGVERLGTTYALRGRRRSSRLLLR